MTTLRRRPRGALVVIDVQNDVMTAAHDREAVVGAIAGLVERARGEGVQVIWVQHSDAEMSRGSGGWQIVPELSPADGETVVHKLYGDAFEDTTLEAVLAKGHVGRLVVAGAQTDACIRSTLHGAFVRGYDVTLVSDAHTTEDLSAWGAPPPAGVIAHTNLYWAHQSAPGRVADVAGAADVNLERSPGPVPL